MNRGVVRAQPVAEDLPCGCVLDPFQGEVGLAAIAARRARAGSDVTEPDAPGLPPFGPRDLLEDYVGSKRYFAEMRGAEQRHVFENDGRGRLLAADGSRHRRTRCFQLE